MKSFTINLGKNTESGNVDACVKGFFINMGNDEEIVPYLVIRGDTLLEYFSAFVPEDETITGLTASIVNVGNVPFVQISLSTEPK